MPRNGALRRSRACLVALSTMTAAELLAMLPAQAALPPYYQRQRELLEILTSGEVRDHLQEQPIDAIERTADDVYRVRAGECLLEVRIADDPAFDPEPGWVGPRHFVLDVDTALCD